MLKVKSQGRKDAPDADLPIRDLLNWLRGEIRERDAATRAAGMRAARAGPSEGVGGEGGAGGEHHHHHHHHSGQQQDVRVLVAQTKSKKFNRQAVVEQAQTSAVRLAQSFLEGPIVAIETTDPVMDLVQSTALSDPETWRKGMSVCFHWVPRWQQVGFAGWMLTRICVQSSRRLAGQRRSTFTRYTICWRGGVRSGGPKRGRATPSSTTSARATVRTMIWARKKHRACFPCSFLSVLFSFIGASRKQWDVVACISGQDWTGIGGQHG